MKQSGSTYQQKIMFGLTSFHNSTKEREERKLSVYEETNRAQNKRILAFMGSTQDRNWTSFELEKEFPQMARESIRRACTDNSKDSHNPDGYLVDTGKRREGKRDNGVKRKYIVWQWVEPLKRTTK